MLQDRAGIIVLREDLDFYAIPPKPDIDQAEMIEVKRAAGRALLKQDGIFSGLRRSEEAGSTEQHLIEMLTAGYFLMPHINGILLTVCSGFNHDDIWGHRAGEPNKAVVCSLALARLRTDVRGNANDAANSNAVGMAQKLLLFWRKPARRCWWEGVELDGVDGLEGKKLKVWIRRVWTLEMVRSSKMRLIIRETDLDAECNRASLSAWPVIIDFVVRSSPFRNLIYSALPLPEQSLLNTMTQQAESPE